MIEGMKEVTGSKFQVVSLMGTECMDFGTLNLTFGILEFETF